MQSNAYLFVSSTSPITVLSTSFSKKRMGSAVGGKEVVGPLSSVKTRGAGGLSGWPVISCQLSGTCGI